MADHQYWGPDALQRIAAARQHHKTAADRRADAQARQESAFFAHSCGHMHTDAGLARCLDARSAA